MVMPPGEVCPAMVTSPRVRCTGASIRPLTANTMVRGPVSSSAACSEPGPLALRLVTVMTRPPRPPVACAPKPAAPGKARPSNTRVGRCMATRLSGLPDGLQAGDKVRLAIVRIDELTLDIEYRVLGRLDGAAPEPVALDDAADDVANAAESTPTTDTPP